jgi:hypothetical protein
MRVLSEQFIYSYITVTVLLALLICTCTYSTATLIARHNTQWQCGQLASELAGEAELDRHLAI